MSAGRGALIVFEGCDRVGKSTQCKKLVEALLGCGLKASLMKFPDRETTIGKYIDAYLRKDIELPDHSVHLLFSANRWEMVSEMRSQLLSGTSLVLDRYTYSGVAYTAAKQVASLEWCKAPDSGLPAPDVVFYLKLSPEEAEKRAVFGDERYEQVKFQREVEKQFELLKDSQWRELDASQDISALHSEITSTAKQIIAGKKQATIATLWPNKQL